STSIKITLVVPHLITSQLLRLIYLLTLNLMFLNGFENILSVLLLHLILSDAFYFVNKQSLSSPQWSYLVPFPPSDLEIHVQYNESVCILVNYQHLDR